MSDLILNYLNLADLSPSETVRAAAQGGFRAVGLRISDHVPGGAPGLVGDTTATAEVRKIADGLGVTVATVSTFRILAERTVEEYRDVLETTAALGCRTIALNVFTPDSARAAALIGGIARKASGYGIRLSLEFIPVSGMKTLADANRMVRGADAPNVGINLDALHFIRSGGQVEDIASAVPDTLHSFHLCDAPLAAPADLAAEMRGGRLYPGEGEFPLHKMLDACPIAIEIEVEVPNRRVAHISGGERARRALAAGQRFIDAHRRRSR